MKKSIMINGQPFWYDAVDLNFAEGEAITHDQAKEILFKMKDLLDEKGIKFWLMYGTLLGAVRDKDFIPYDFDVDIQTKDVDKLENSIPWFDQQGVKLIRAEQGRLYSFTIDSVYIDVYIAKDAPFPLNIWCSWLNGFIVPTKLIYPLSELDFLGKRFLIPGNSEKLMEFFYGKTWKTPIPGAHGRYDIYPVYFYRRYIKKWLGR